MSGDEGSSSPDGKQEAVMRVARKHGGEGQTDSGSKRYKCPSSTSPKRRRLPVVLVVGEALHLTIVPVTGGVLELETTLLTTASSSS